MLRIELKASEKVRLEQLRLNRGSNIAERAYYVLLSSEGYSTPQIAKRLGRNIYTVRQWLNRYVRSGVDGLVSKKQPGRPAVKEKLLLSELGTLLSASPSDYGYQESGWQVNILRDYFSKQGCVVCENTLIKALKKLGYVYKRFSKTIPKNVPSKAEKTRVISDLVDILKQYDSSTTEILFEDESHFSNQPYVSRGWFKKKEKKQSTR